MIKNKTEQLNTMCKAKDIPKLFHKINNVISELKSKSNSNSNCIF
jgi:hypothetical protein